MPSRPHIKFGGHREDKENQGPSRDRGGPTTIGVPGHSGMILIHEDDDEDGPILYRDDDDDSDEMEDEGAYDLSVEFFVKSILANLGRVFYFYIDLTRCKNSLKFKFKSAKTLIL